jgi:AcrR family transcriptional regulator
VSAAVLDLPRLARRLPEAPPPELGPALDAAARCLARHGVSRTSMNDIARELRVSRSGIYRQLGSIDRTVRLLMAREVNELVTQRLPATLASASGPEVVLAIVEEVVDFARRHPVVQKVIADEPELIGPYLLTDLPEVTAQVSDLVAPLLEQAMDAGLVRRQDPTVLAAWLTRIVVALVLDPVDGPLRPMLNQMLLPALTPEPEQKSPRRSS